VDVFMKSNAQSTNKNLNLNDVDRNHNNMFAWIQMLPACFRLESV